jgi:hypothetical protein
MPDETPGACNEPERDTISAGLGIDLNVFVKPGREQPVNGARHLSDIQWFTGPHKLRILQVSGINGLLFRLVLNGCNGSSAEILRTCHCANSNE